MTGDPDAAAPPAALPGRARVLPFGDRGYLLEPVGGMAEPGPLATRWVLSVARAARGRWPGATVVAGLASVLVAFDAPAGRPADLVDGADLVLADADAGSGAVAPRLHRIPTRYDGPDLPEVARALGLPAGEVVARHRRAEWTVAALGFAPGFGYLTCPDPLFAAVARRADPRPRVPAGAVAVAAGMCAIYPAATPGGWQLLGSSDVVLFDPDEDPPALLSVGDRVRFDEVP